MEIDKNPQHNMKEQLSDKNIRLQKENIILRTKIKELEAERLTILGIIESAPELNPCNFTQDEVMEINVALIEIFQLLEGK